MSYHQCRILAPSPLLFPAVAFLLSMKRWGWGCWGPSASPSGRALLAAEVGAGSFWQPDFGHLEPSGSGRAAAAIAAEAAAPSASGGGSEQSHIRLCARLSAVLATAWEAL